MVERRDRELERRAAVHAAAATVTHGRALGGALQVGGRHAARMAVEAAGRAWEGDPRKGLASGQCHLAGKDDTPLRVARAGCKGQRRPTCARTHGGRETRGDACRSAQRRGNLQRSSAIPAVLKRPPRIGARAPVSGYLCSTAASASTVFPKISRRRHCWLPARTVPYAAEAHSPPREKPGRRPLHQFRRPGSRGVTAGAKPPAYTPPASGDRLVEWGVARIGSRIAAMILAAVASSRSRSGISEPSKGSGTSKPSPALRGITCT